MNITAVKSDTANVLVTAKIESADIEKNINKIAKQLAKTQSVDGFRKGKVPVTIIKKIYKDKLQEEAESDAINQILKEAREELDIKAEDIVGEPVFKKYDKKDDGGIELEITISLKPTIDNIDYEKLIPEYEEPSVESSEIDERVEELMDNFSKFKSIKEDRELSEGDQAVFDFVGKIDGKEFDGGKAKDFELIIGSNQFIKGFEEQMKGMKRGETKDITLTFPEDYQSKELAGKEAIFTITLNDIKVKDKPELDDEMAKKLLPGEEDITPNKIKELVEVQIKSEKISKIYQDELKPKFMEALVTECNFDLPLNILEQEIDAQVNQKAQTMSKEELATYQNNNEKIDELRESLREDAINSVKATFIVDAMARSHKITVDDYEVTQTIYHEAMVNGQDPQQIIDYYKENNLLPAIKMGLIEDKLFYKILGLNK